MSYVSSVLAMSAMDQVIEAIGWGATILFVASFLVKQRSLLHLLGFAACIFKMVYSYHYHVWPLFANWVILFFIEIVQWWRYRGAITPHAHPIDLSPNL